jgi:glycosyltransferase involved in cell wall biosynthesis
MDDRSVGPDLCYYPKGFLPAVENPRFPRVVTIHDAILQHYWDHYPSWRNSFEYSYWARMLKHTLTAADCILTVSQSAKRQILDFMARHDLPAKEITVTYEPCLYEPVPQPVNPPKEDFVVHLASHEPHKRTTWLVKWWIERAPEGSPQLHLIGKLPQEAAALARSSPRVVVRPFLEDSELQAVLGSARALILPSEIEGFGLPGIEAYYLGTPVCHVAKTSVEEVLEVATSKGRFSLEEPDSLRHALEEVLAMTAEEIRGCGLVLRETYSTTRVAAAMMNAFREVKARHSRRPAC